MTPGPRPQPNTLPRWCLGAHHPSPSFPSLLKTHLSLDALAVSRSKVQDGTAAGSGPEGGFGFDCQESVVNANVAAGPHAFRAPASLTRTGTALVPSARGNAGRGPAASAEAFTLACVPYVTGKRRRVSFEALPSSGHVSGEVSVSVSVSHPPFAPTGLPLLTEFAADPEGGKGCPILPRRREVGTAVFRNRRRYMSVVQVPAVGMLAGVEAGWSMEAEEAVEAALSTPG